ncbi:hypothetical protein AB6A40_003781 [Gnathostoma spinigerum]|uniref:Secreted protein n=1 Tax=Gnathostoma spinigerum TaxID=75299 RepID=A0ABD6EK47_9BILA
MLYTLAFIICLVRFLHIALFSKLSTISVTRVIHTRIFWNHGVIFTPAFKNTKYEPLVSADVTDCVASAKKPIC